MSNALTMIEKTDGTVKGMVASQATAYRQDHKESEPFAPLRQDNHVETYTTGKSYFAAVHAAMKAATKCIFIIGWQVSWDVELIPGERLIDVLHDRVQSSEEFRVYVLPWMSPKVGMNTGDLDTMLAVFQLNAGRKKMQAMCCPAASQNDYTGLEGTFFAHHQKLVVVDNKTAFIGGMDLAYGRYDDEHFSLAFGHRRLNERYSPGVPPLKDLTPADGRCLSAMDLLAGTLSAPFWKAGSNTDPSALSKLFDSLSKEVATLAIDAVSLTNRGAQYAREGAAIGTQYARDGLNASTKYVADGAHEAVRGAISVARDGAHIAVAAGNAVSQTCANLKIPDLYGAIEQHRVGADATSGLPTTLQHTEEGARSGWNGMVNSAGGLFEFMAPLKRLRVDPRANSGLAGAAASAERGARWTANTMIDGAAAVGGDIQSGAASVRDVCVEIGPGVQHGVTATKNAVQGGVAATKNAARQTAESLDQAGQYASAKVHEAQQTVEGAINEIQKSVIGQINVLRASVNDQALRALSVGGQFLSEGVTSARVQALVDQLKRFLKLVYLSQLALDWNRAYQHPLLLDKTVKAAPAGAKIPSDAQVREPWQDVHCRIVDGPAVYDLSMNFIRRWDATHASYLSDGTLGDAGALVAAAFAGLTGLISPVNGDSGKLLAPAARKAVMIPDAYVPKPPPAGPASKPTGVAVRVLRSASAKLQKQEAIARNTNAVGKVEQCEIQTQMINVITNATDFIYIENQFFQSDFGKPSVESFADSARQYESPAIRYLMNKKSNAAMAALTTAGHSMGAELLPKNGISAALGSRIEMAVRRGEPFHVYLVLPLHPEGKLNDILVVGQVHWTMQSLVFADHSLVNRVKRAIKAKEICKNALNDGRWDEAMVAADSVDASAHRPFFHAVQESQWSKYLTLLNLRNCQYISGVARTEQIYVHSKLLIADDRHIILGSANINDRSQSGKRDSELAVMLFDTSREKKNLRSVLTTVNPLARDLRIRLWKKHLAFAGANEIVKSAAGEMTAKIEAPADEQTILAIQSLARNNATQYRAAFAFLPWSDRDTGSSLWPVCTPGTKMDKIDALAASMPFDERFWGKTTTAPVNIKGFFTAFPINWTIGENNHPRKFSAMSLTMNENDSSPLQTSNRSLA